MAWSSPSQLALQAGWVAVLGQLAIEGRFADPEKAGRFKTVPLRRHHSPEDCFALNFRQGHDLAEYVSEQFLCLICWAHSSKIIQLVSK